MKKAKRNMAIGYVIVMIPLLVLPLLIQSRADMGLINTHCCYTLSLWA